MFFFGFTKAIRFYFFLYVFGTDIRTMLTSHRRLIFSIEGMGLSSEMKHYRLEFKFKFIGRETSIPSNSVTLT